jgi:hypothetical protein
VSEAHWQEVALWVIGICATAFPFIYMIFAKWRSWVGVTLIVSDISLACLVDPSLLSEHFHFTIGYHWITAIVWFVAITAVARCAMVPGVQWQGRRARQRAQLQHVEVAEDTPESNPLLDGPPAQM